MLLKYSTQKKFDKRRNKALSILKKERGKWIKPSEHKMHWGPFNVLVNKGVARKKKYFCYFVYKIRQD